MSSLHVLAGVPGVLSAADVAQTAAALVALQRPSGQIPWFVGGHCDPWNHVEAAMALTASGHLDAAQAAYDWLARVQFRDGSWFNYYQGDDVKDPRLDTNVGAYVATGVWHYCLATGDVDAVRRWWPMVQRAMDWVTRWQRPDGSMAWSLDGRGVTETYALLTGSSSIYHSLRCAVALADFLEEPRPAWELAAGRLGHALAHHPEAFAPKDEFAMDWYYPILSGAVRGAGATRRLAASWPRFVMDDLGVRCVSTNDWITAAETAETVLTLDAMGERARALELFACTSRHRLDDGRYLTGIVYPQRVTFPGLEASSYTAAAVLLAVDALTDSTPAAGLFRHGVVPAAVDWPEPGCVLAPR